MSQLAEQATRHAAFAEGVKTRYTNDLLALLDDIEETLLGRVAKYDTHTWPRARAERQLASFRKMASAKYGTKIIDTLNEQIREFAEYEAGFEARSLGNIAPSYNFSLPTETQIMTAVTLNPLSVEGAAKGKLLEPYIKDFTEGQVARLSNSIRAGFAQGETTPVIIQRLKQDVFPINQRGLGAMARTALQHCAMQAKLATYKANDDIIKGYRILATLDLKTSAICRFEGEKAEVYKVGEGPVPPLHWQCRSTTVSVLDQRFYILDKGATQRARDPATGKVGYVDADLGYYDWLKTQDRQFVAEVVGPTRAKLLLDGNMSGKRFAELGMTKFHNERTLKEMRKLEPLVFKKAEI